MCFFLNFFLTAKSQCSTLLLYNLLGSVHITLCFSYCNLISQPNFSTPSLSSIFFNVLYPGFLSPKKLQNHFKCKYFNTLKLGQHCIWIFSLNLSKCCVCFSLGHQTTSELVGKNDAFNLLPMYFAKQFLLFLIKIFFSIINLLNTNS